MLELSDGITEYPGVGEGMTRRKKNDTKTRALVATARTSRNDDVSPGKRYEDSVEKKKALSPNAARGKAVAAPLFAGQFKAAIYSQKS